MASDPTSSRLMEIRKMAAVMASSQLGASCTHLAYKLRPRVPNRPSVPVYVNRCTNFRAVSATSCQPLSIVSEWPRFGILVISVTAGLRRCRL